ncbi:hypothetical protein [Lacrimispora saccharolytica]|uniref:Lipoprotein n=1 Tax=Lacrimispora saccharolytica (strain ATCC 35040 / DSM 2544 / NRCC 2533 / WM1) TaxID=610130 RepID=D9R423_LACSW|nr:hypothetical protein [Lacrimispora saccharolytica]ADL03136.1 hypothetical protein Closa_0499 [[Clostridium] saccharolyticum WM1]
MMKNKALIICAMSAMLLTGCTESHILASGGPAEPVFETQQGIVLDWTQIGNDMDDEFVDNEEYPMALSVNYSVDNENKSIDLTLIVKEGTTPEEAVTFADVAVRFLNDEASMQDFSYEKSSNTSYGGFFKIYDLHLIVMPDYTMKDKKYWLVDMDIPKGSDEKIVPKEGAVVMETTAADQEEDTESSESDQ